MKKAYFAKCAPALLIAALALGMFSGCDSRSKADAPAGQAAAPSRAPLTLSQAVVRLLGLAAPSRAPLTLSQDAAGTVTVSGTDFSAKFSSKTGSLDALVYKGKNIFFGGNGPKLDAFRAIVNNDGWAYRKWFQYGLFDMAHEVVGAPYAVRNSDGTVTFSALVRSRGKNEGVLKGDPLVQGGNPLTGLPVKIERRRALGENDFSFLTQQIWTVYPDGSIELAASISSNRPETDLPRLGYAMDVPAAFSDFTYYGRGPQENYRDRESGAFIGIYESSVKEQFVNYTKPQEMANHEDVRWCALRDAKGDGAIFIASLGEFSAQALPVKAEDLLLASNTFKLKEKIEKTQATTLRLDAGVRGLGGASCGPDTEPRDKVFAVQTDFGFIIRPVSADSDLSVLANVSPAGAVPISIVRDEATGVVSVLSRNADKKKILVSVDGRPAQECVGQIPFRDGGKISAWYADGSGARSEMTFPKIEKVRPKVIFASSQNSVREAAANLTDNDPATLWHTEYSVTQKDYPHWVDFDVGETRKIKGVSYLPRQDGSGNGDVKGYEIFVSADGKNWGAPVASGAFSSDKAEKRVLFSAPVEARYVRFRALSAQRNEGYASGAEFSVLED